jgi:hypothetical protein
MKGKKQVYLEAWEHPESNCCERVLFEVSDRYKFAHNNSQYAGIVRGNVTVTVYTCYWRETSYIPKEVLRNVAICYLDGNYVTTEIDLRSGE